MMVDSSLPLLESCFSLLCMHLLEPSHHQLCEYRYSAGESKLVFTILVLFWDLPLLLRAKKKFVLFSSVLLSSGRTGAVFIWLAAFWNTENGEGAASWEAFVAARERPEIDDWVYTDWLSLLSASMETLTFSILDVSSEGWGSWPRRKVSWRSRYCKKSFMTISLIR